MRYFVALVLGFVAFSGNAQERRDVLGVRAYYGYLWPHRPSSWILVNGHSRGIELFAERRFPCDREWQQCYAGPSAGLGLMVVDFQFPERIGLAWRLVPYLKLPFGKWLGMRLGWGIGYISKSYDEQENSKQIAIGTRLNTAIQLALEAHWDSPKLMYTAGISLDHWSNGAYQMPNLGINALALYVGVGFGHGKPFALASVIDTVAPVARTEYSVAAAFGVHEVDGFPGEKRSVIAITADRSHRFTRKSAWMVGLDLFRKPSLELLHPEWERKSEVQPVQLGIHGGYALCFGRGEIFLQTGGYVYTPVDDQLALYNRLGCRYRSGKHLLLHLALKSHMAMADHWEFGAGYRW